MFPVFVAKSKIIQAQALIMLSILSIDSEEITLTPYVGASKPTSVVYCESKVQTIKEFFKDGEIVWFTTFLHGNELCVFFANSDFYFYSSDVTPLTLEFQQKVGYLMNEANKSLKELGKTAIQQMLRQTNEK